MYSFCGELIATMLCPILLVENNILLYSRLLKKTTPPSHLGLAALRLSHRLNFLETNNIAIRRGDEGEGTFTHHGLWDDDFPAKFLCFGKCGVYIADSH